MKLIRTLLSLPPLAAATAGVWAQQRTAADAPAAETPTVELSPFVVNSERDTGYAAATTLAGTRLNTPVKDIGASLSIYTKDFLTDLGVTSASDLLVYATGMDAAGPQGNYSGATNSIAEPQVIGEGPRVNPQSGSRTRGLATPEYTRGFFISDIAIDSYNTSAVTVNRGPNAMLFGIGSPAGVVDTTLVAADLNRDQNKIEQRVGDNGSLRHVLDLNRVVIPGKLGLRLAALDDHEKFDQRPAYEKKTRLFGTATYRPFRSTAIRGNFETGKTRANRPITVLPFNSISEYWYAAGRPTYDWTFYDDPARNPSASTQAAQNFRPPTINQAQIFGGIVIPYSSSTARTPDLSFVSVVNGTGGTGLNQIRNGLFHPTANRDQAGDGINFYETTNIGETALPATLFPGGVRPAGVKMQGFTNYDVFAFNRRMLDETSYQDDNFRTYTAALEQGAWRDRNGQDRVGIELAYYRQQFDRNSKNSFFSQGNGNHIRIDPNVTLPDGRPNPNVGRPYASGASNASWDWVETDRETLRATAYIRYDFKELSPRAGKWLGRHTLTGLAEQNAVDNLIYQTRLGTTGAVADTVGAAVDRFNRRPNVLVYIGDSILDGRDLRLEPIRIPELTAGVTSPTRYFNAPAGSTAQGDWAQGETSLPEILHGGTATREVIKSQAAILQSYWLADHVITTIGWRKDKDYLSRLNLTYPNNPTKNRFRNGEFGFRSTPPFNVEGEVESYSVVVRWPKRLLRLPEGTDLSLFYNESSNFTPAGGRITALNQKLTPPEGTTEEFGFGLSLLNDRLNIRYNRFETRVTNASFNSPSYSAAYGNGVSQIAGFWAGERNINPGIDRTAEIERLFSPVPEFRDAYGFQLVTNANGTFGFTGTIPPGITDTTDYVARGHEVEIVYNATRNWRTLLNVSKQETVQSNIAPNTREFVEKMRPIWAEFAGRPRSNYPAGYVPGTPLPPGTETVGSWVQTNVLVPYATTLANEGQVSAEQRKWRVNLVTNYSFDRESRLKGFAIGSGVRWQDKYALGYPTRFNPDGSVFVDIANPFWSDDDLNVDAWVSYQRRILNGRVDWKVQLNVRNLIGDEDPLAITVQPDGSPAITRLPPEKRIYLTNTFSF